MDPDRRASPRHPVSVYFNKYIDGRPYLAEVVELSATGVLVRKIHEPDAPRACYALEIAPASAERVWVCGAPVWSHGPFEALTFVGQSPSERARLEALIADLPR